MHDINKIYLYFKWGATKNYVMHIFTEKLCDNYVSSPIKLSLGLPAAFCCTPTVVS